MPQMHQTRPFRGRVGCDLLPGASQLTHSPFTHSPQRQGNQPCPHRRQMLARVRCNLLRLEVSRLEAVERNRYRVRNPLLTVRAYGTDAAPKMTQIDNILSDGRSRHG